MKKLAIIIPVYKEDVDVFEKISLSQLSLITEDRYDVFFVGPTNLSFENYLVYFSRAKILGFPESFFKGLEGYNKLCMHPSFYEHFFSYDFILIHHTDALLFCDNLPYFMDMSYDYIGAPIMLPFNFQNGGLSLRNPKECYNLLIDLKGRLGYLDKVDSRGAEDIFFSSLLPRVADRKTAMSFAWENVDYIDLYKKTIGKNYPMGCHSFNVEHYGVYEFLVKDEIKEKYRKEIDEQIALYQKYNNNCLIMPLLGRLGNSMFVYAACKFLEKQTGI